MTVAPIPDIEKVTSYFLRDAITTRVVGKTPASITEPWIRVTLISAPGAYPDHLVEANLQLDVYAGAAGGQPEANQIATELRAKIQEMAEVDHENAVVAGVRIVNMWRVPDADLEPARDRVIMQASVYYHAA